MKTFLVLFAIAVSFPTEAQRVKENVRQRSEIVDVSASEVAEVVDVSEKDNSNNKKKEQVEKIFDASRKR